MESINLVNLVKDSLKDFKLYKKSHKVLVDSTEYYGILIGYRTNKHILAPKATHYDLQIQKDICYVNKMWIEEKDRLKGHGKQLYETIENLCKKLKVKTIRLTPSGQGEKFWPKMGFKPLKSSGYWEAIKYL